MPRNTLSSAGGMLKDLKSRLGFSDSEGGYQAGASDDFDEYDDFDSDGFNARDDREYAGYGSDYDEDAPVGGYRPASVHSSRFGRADSTPDLVSLDDVKAHTQVSDSLLRDPLDPGSLSRASSRSTGRNLVTSSPATNSPAYQAQLRERETRSRSEGLDSLFEPTSTDASAYDPYEAYSSAKPRAFTTTRGLTVIEPVAYGDVERVARALKAGDVVVLAMRATPDDLSKRVLDFSFGVASALDAGVECPAEKVFAIAKGQALTDSEKMRLRTQGVL